MDMGREYRHEAIAIGAISALDALATSINAVVVNNLTTNWSKGLFLAFAVLTMVMVAATFMAAVMTIRLGQRRRPARTKTRTPPPQPEQASRPRSPNPSAAEPTTIDNARYQLPPGFPLPRRFPIQRHGTPTQIDPRWPPVDEDGQPQQEPVKAGVGASAPVINLNPSKRIPPGYRPPVGGFLPPGQLPVPSEPIPNLRGQLSSAVEPHQNEVCAIEERSKWSNALETVFDTFFMWAILLGAPACWFIWRAIEATLWPG
jgi:hypothetical protein